MPPPKRQPKGWTFPGGYNYLGPGNPLDNGEPLNPADEAAKKHDQSYNQHLEAGENPYTHFTDSDQTLLDDLSGQYDPGALAAKAYFTAKKYVAPAMPPKKQAPIVTRGNQALLQKFFPEVKKSANRDTRRQKATELRKGNKWYWTRQQSKKGGAQASAGANADPGEGTSSQSFEDISDQTPADVTMDEPMQTAGGPGEGGGGGGQGGGGVGSSTGNFNNTVEFKYGPDGEVTIVSNCSRNIMVPESFNNIEYKLEGSFKSLDSEATIDVASRFQKDYAFWVKTPWGTIDCNNWGCFFNPAQFQHLINDMTDWELISITEQWYNVQIKQKTENSDIITYTNDLTAQMLFAKDTNDEMQWPHDGSMNTMVGYTPTRASTLKEYRYYANYNSENITTKTIADEGGYRIKNTIDAGEFVFQLVEDLMPIEVLRTGDNIHFGSFQFECQKYRNLKNWQGSRQMGLPPSSVTDTDQFCHDQRLIGDSKEITNITTNNVYSESSGLRPGRDGIFERKQTNIWTHGGLSSMAKGPAYASYNSDESAVVGEQRHFVVDYQHGQGSFEGLGQNSTSFANFKQNISYSGVTNSKMTNQIGATKEQLGTIGRQVGTNYHPFTFWDWKHVHYPMSPIWGKRPKADHKQTAHPMAAFMCDKVPATTFVKLDPQFVETYDENASTNTTLNTFGKVTVTWTLTMKAKLLPPNQRNLLPKWTIPQKGNQTSEQWLKNVGGPTSDGTIDYPAVGGPFRPTNRY